MKLTNARRLAAVAASVLAAGALVASGPAQGVAPGTGPIDYSCKITKDYKYTFTFDQDTNTPATGYLGRSYVYTAKTDFPEVGVGFARSLGVTYIDGAIDATVLRNGVPITIHAPIPRTNVPTNTNKMSLVARGVVPVYTKTGGAPVLYKPSNIKFSVNAHKADNSSLFALDKGDCTMAPNTKVIDTIKYVKSPTKTVTTAGYAKAAKKVTAGAVIRRTSGVPAAGKVTFTLFKGSAKVKSIVATVVSNKAGAVFTGVKAKGTYKVVAAYGGSGALKGSSSSKTFTIS